MKLISATLAAAVLFLPQISEAGPSKVVNNSPSTIRVYWRAAGCAGVKDGLLIVCQWRDITSTKSASYTYRVGTSGRQVSIRCPAKKSPSHFTNVSKTITITSGRCHLATNTTTVSKPFLIVNKASGLCLDIKGYNARVGDRAMLYRCDGGRDQVFQRYGTGLRNGKNNLALLNFDRAGNVQLAKKGRQFRSLPGFDGWGRLAVTKRTCLAPAGPARARTPIKTARCNNSEAQLWILIQDPN